MNNKNSIAQGIAKYIALALVVLMTNCRYEDGPAISFKSAKKRLTTDLWHIHGEMYKNGTLMSKQQQEDILCGGGFSLIGSMYFSAEGNVSFVNAIEPYCSIDGTWEFMKSKTEIHMTLTDSSGQDIDVNWKILRLYYKPFSKKVGDTEGEGDLWVEETRGYDVYEFHFYILKK